MIKNVSKALLTFFFKKNILCVLMYVLSFGKILEIDNGKMKVTNNPF